MSAANGTETELAPPPSVLLGFRLRFTHKMRRILLLGFGCGVLAAASMGCQQPPARQHSEVVAGAPPGRHRPGRRFPPDRRHRSVGPDAQRHAGRLRAARAGPSGAGLGHPACIRRAAPARWVSRSSWIACSTAGSAASSTRSTAIDAYASTPIPAAGYAATVEPIDKDITSMRSKGGSPGTRPRSRRRWTRWASGSIWRCRWRTSSPASSTSRRNCSRATASAWCVERQMREGAFVGYGAILAAEFVASGRPLRPSAMQRRAPGRPTTTSRAAR